MTIAQPEDLRIEDAEALDFVGKTHKDGFHALFCDGKVALIPHTVNPRLLEKLLTRNGREDLSELRTIR